MTIPPIPEEDHDPAESEQPSPPEQEAPALEGSGYAFQRYDQDPLVPPEDTAESDAGDPGEGEVEPPSPQPDAPAETAALSITIQSWATPLVGLMMLIVGLAGGFFVRPYILPAESSPAAAPSTNTGQQGTTGNTQTQRSPEERAALMDALLPNVRHFLGDENAPITLIEFSDFQ